MFDLLAKLPYDKALHFVYGVLIFALSCHFVSAMNSILIVVFVASGKEVYDIINKDIHTPDILDFTATLAGGIVCASVLI